MIHVVGARGTISDIDEFLQKLSQFATKEQISIQALNADAVYGAQHLISAAEHALRSFAQGTNATNTLPLEIMLYAAGERQIQKAIKKMGVKTGRQAIAFVIIDQKRKKDEKSEFMIKRLLILFDMTSDESVLGGNPITLKNFGITQKELRTVPKEKYGDLILEKVAMVDVQK
ncbi:MAG TPA: KEOPS complex subunit Cgi121 [Candidatus Thermoplasmatota archaeon]|nr:KEOPS complex subunit Cgi121 [Candidatus Thermoplasmatota archaeon]